METKPLSYGLIGFFLEGLLVSIAATTFDKPVKTTVSASMHQKNKLSDKNIEPIDSVCF
jgi:hypothetical protein